MNSVTIDAVFATIKSDAGRVLDFDEWKEDLEVYIYAALMTILDKSYLVQNTKLIEVRNGMMKMPCDMVRLIRIQYPNGARFSDYNRILGNELVQAPIANGQMKVIYWSLPFKEDDNGEKVLAITPEQIPYLAYSAIEKAMMQKWTNGEIPENVYRAWERKKVNYRAVAHVVPSMDEMEGAIRMLRIGSFFNPRR